MMNTRVRVTRTDWLELGDDPGQYPDPGFPVRIQFTTTIQDFLKDSLFTIAIPIDSLEQNKTCTADALNRSLYLFFPVDARAVLHCK